MFVGWIRFITARERNPAAMIRAPPTRACCEQFGSNRVLLSMLSDMQDFKF
jgi:hypothetical protein